MDAVDKYVRDLDTAYVIINSLVYKTAKWRMGYVFYYKPEFQQLSNTVLGKLLGLARETVARNRKHFKGGT